VLLVLAVFVGTRIGDRVLHQVATRQVVGAVPIPSPESADQSDGQNTVFWKREQVVAVSTDPGFPDPRVTPPPPPPPTPTPRPTIPPPTPLPTLEPTPIYEAPPTELLTPVPPPSPGLNTPVPGYPYVPTAAP